MTIKLGQIMFTQEFKKEEKEAVPPAEDAANPDQMGDQNEKDLLVDDDGRLGENEDCGRAEGDWVRPADAQKGKSGHIDDTYQPNQ